MTLIATAESAAHRQASRSAQADSPHFIAEALVENLQAELVHCALLTSTTASLALAIAAGRSPGSRSGLGDYLPPSPTSFPVLAAQYALDAEVAPLIGTLREYYDLLSLARSVTQSAVAAPAGSPHPSGDIHSLAATWQTVAAAALRALYGIDRQWPWTASTAARKARQHLSAVCRGDASCIDASGRLVVPVLAERRDEVRTRVRSYVVVARGHALHRLLVLDATPRGFGAEGLTDVSPGEKIQIIWRPGRLIEATVAWAREGKLGLELTHRCEDGAEFIGSLLEDTPVELLDS